MHIYIYASDTAAARRGQTLGTQATAVRLHVHMYISTHMCIYMYLRIHMYTCILMYMCIHSTRAPACVWYMGR